MSFVLLPVYNEEKLLPALLAKLKSAPGDVAGGSPLFVCVEGGSDKTGELLARCDRVARKTVRFVISCSDSLSRRYSCRILPKY